MQRGIIGVFIPLIFFTTGWAQVNTSYCHYGTKAIPLSTKPEFVQKNTALKFWSLFPHYLPQWNGESCSVASVLMILNAAKRLYEPCSIQLISRSHVLRRKAFKQWRAQVKRGGDGVVLDELASYLKSAIESFGLNISELAVKRAFVSTKQNYSDFLTDLQRTHLEPNSFLILNYDQGFLMETGRSFGHFAPVAAFDSKQNQVLVFDPDRSWYEPYWVEVKHLYDSMSFIDSESKKSRGYIFLKVEDDKQRKKHCSSCNG